MFELYTENNGFVKQSNKTVIKIKGVVKQFFSYWKDDIIYLQ